MDARPRLSSVSSYASSSSLSSYYGCASGVSDVELTNDTSYGGGLKSRTLFDDVKVILSRHDRKLLKLEDDMMLMVRWLHEKFGFILKAESTSSIPTGWEENILDEEDSVVFSDDEDINDSEATANTRKTTTISTDPSQMEDIDEADGSQSQQLELESIRESESDDDESCQDNTITFQRTNNSLSQQQNQNLTVAPLPQQSSVVKANLPKGHNIPSSSFDLKSVTLKQATLSKSDLSVIPSSASTISAPKPRQEVLSDRLPTQTKTGRGKRPTQCDVCGKFLKDQCTLRQHKQIHQTVRPFPCPEPECGKSFRRKFHLQTHMLIHEGVRKHQCGYCGRLFLLQKDLISHERLHTGEKPFQCPECPKSFNLKSHLVMHVRTHTGEKPYNCDICSKNFSQSNSLRIHKKKVHQPGKPQASTTTTAAAESRSKSKKKGGQGGRGRKSKSKDKPPSPTTTTSTVAQPLPAKLPLYRNQGKILNYLVPSIPTTATVATLAPSITFLQSTLPVPTSSSTHRIEILEPIGGNGGDGEQIILPASALNLLSGSGTSIITAAELLDTSQPISLTRNIIL